MTKKKCSQCHLVKPLEDFYRHRAHKSGYHYNCKACNKAAKLRRHETANGRAYSLWDSARQRCKKYKIPFKLTLDWVERRVEKGRCEVTNLPFNLRISDSVKVDAFAPSIDQINPRCGYTPDNCQLVLWAYNNFKGQYDKDILYKIAKAIVLSEEGPAEGRLPGVLVRRLETLESAFTNASPV